MHAEIDGEKLDDDTLIMELLLILIGGDETTRHVISGGMYQLLKNPDQLRALRAERAKLPTAVEEMLRWVSPIQNMSRTVTRDVELRGRELRQGDRLVLLYPSANRDASVFRDPQRFDIERAPNEHIAFGYGAHFCLGASLARLELRVMFEEILDRLPELRLVSDEPPPLRASNFISGIEEMEVEVGARRRRCTERKCNHEGHEEHEGRREGLVVQSFARRSIPGMFCDRSCSLSRMSLSTNERTPFDKLRVSGQSPLQSTHKPLRLSSSKPRFGENRQTRMGEGWGEGDPTTPLPLAHCAGSL